MTTLALVAFATFAAALWLSLFGYYLLLWALISRPGSKRRQPDRAATPELPAIAIVVPTLDEQDWIGAKIQDLQRTDYPAERVQFVVVDGNSADQTAAIVRAAQPAEPRLQLLCAPKARRKQHQFIHALRSLEQDYLVFNDADSALEPDCARRLIELLLDDPDCGIAAARIVPETRLLEERMHWQLMNTLWWLEGETQSATGFSGVCYAVRRSAVEHLKLASLTEDIYLACAVSANGYRVRLCPDAQARELRVPQRWQDLIAFRQRRGAGYVYELVRGMIARPRPRWNLARGMRLWHLLVLPGASAVTAALGLALAVAGHWQWPAAVLAGFVLSALALVAAPSRGSGQPRLLLTAARYLALAAASLLTLRWPRDRVQIARGGAGHAATDVASELPESHRTGVQ